MTPGTRFGSYEITGALGAGGMGEVVLGASGPTWGSLALALLFACALLAVASCTKAPAWEALPLGTSADFRDIWFTDADTG
jgi:hypothetical protein